MKNTVFKAILILVIVLRSIGFLIFLANGCEWVELFTEIFDCGTIILFSIVLINLLSKCSGEDN